MTQEIGCVNYNYNLAFFKMVEVQDKIIRKTEEGLKVQERANGG